MSRVMMPSNFKGLSHCHHHWADRFRNSQGESRGSRICGPPVYTPLPPEIAGPTTPQSNHHGNQYQSCASSAASHRSASIIHAGAEGEVWSVTPQSQGVKHQGYLGPLVSGSIPRMRSDCSGGY